MIFDIKNFIREPYVQTTGIAAAIMLLINILFYDQSANWLSVSIMIVLITGSAYLLSSSFQKDSIRSHFMVGAFSYAIYLFLMLFLKITEEVPNMQDEIFTVLIFGGLSAAAYWALTKK